MVRKLGHAERARAGRVPAHDGAAHVGAISKVQRHGVADTLVLVAAQSEKPSAIATGSSISDDETHEPDLQRAERGVAGLAASADRG